MRLNLTLTLPKSLLNFSCSKFKILIWHNRLHQLQLFFLSASFNTYKNSQVISRHGNKWISDVKSRCEKLILIATICVLSSELFILNICTLQHFHVFFVFQLKIAFKDIIMTSRRRLKWKVARIMLMTFFTTCM